MNIVNGTSKWNYDTKNEITYNTENSKSNLCDYIGAHILVRDRITVAAASAT